MTIHAAGRVGLAEKQATEREREEGNQCGGQGGLEDTKKDVKRAKETRWVRADRESLQGFGVDTREGETLDLEGEGENKIPENAQRRGVQRFV